MTHNDIIKDIIDRYSGEYAILKIDRYWGFILLIETKDKIGNCAVYQYHDSRHDLYICGLEVQTEHRIKGIGNKLLSFCETAARDLGVTKTLLWVDKQSWMREWYNRKGYSDLMSHKKHKGCIWMKKRL